MSTTSAICYSLDFVVFGFEVALRRRSTARYIISSVEPSCRVPYSGHPKVHNRNDAPLRELPHCLQKYLTMSGYFRRAFCGDPDTFLRLAPMLTPFRSHLACSCSRVESGPPNLSSASICKLARERNAVPILAMLLCRLPYTRDSGIPSPGSRNP
jgi:hypothetical protein